MNNKYIFLSVFCFFVVLMRVSFGAPPQVWASRGVCQAQVDPNSKCSLQCLFYPAYSGGKCDENGNCICTPKTTEKPNTGEVLTVCLPEEDAEAKCGLMCLFYPQYVRGYCKNGFCYCVRK